LLNSTCAVRAIRSLGTDIIMGITAEAAPVQGA
jgi:hypothetical protein